MKKTCSQVEQLERIRRSPFWRLASEIDTMLGILDLKARDEMPVDAIFSDECGQPYEADQRWREWANKLRRMSLRRGDCSTLPPLPEKSSSSAGTELMRLRDWCIEADTVASHMGLLSDGLQEVWNILEGQALTAKQIRNKVDQNISEDAIRHRIKELRKIGRGISHKSGVGYFRPDAPPTS